MSIGVVVQDANNVTLQITPQPRINLSIDRGVLGPTGPQGLTGPTGSMGQGLEITAVVATPADLPPVGNPGDQILVQSNGHLYVWSA